MLVLERHYVIGGCTHTFTRKGFRWDVGVHCIGSWDDGSLMQRAMVWLADDGIECESIGQTLDHITFPQGAEFDVPISREAWKNKLKARFPSEVDAIDAYVQAVDTAGDAARYYLVHQTLPTWLYKTTAPLLKIFGANKWWLRTTQSVIASFTSNTELTAILASNWGYYGSTPSTSSFAVHALIARHYWDGSYYPVGGSRAFANAFKTSIEKSGGEIVANAEVATVLSNGRGAYGVRLSTGEEITSRTIISAVGAKRTLDLLDPKDAARHKRWTASIETLDQSSAHLNLYLGFEGDIVEAGATKASHWHFASWDMENKYWPVGDENAKPPLLYISFASLRDPKHKLGPQKRHTAQCITLVDYADFAQWKGTAWRGRGDTYQAFKAQLSQRLLDAFFDHYPKLRPLLAYSELSTPLSTEHFIGAPQGAMYGLALDTKRYQTSALRVRTPVKNLMLTGCDVALNGIGGALTGGLLTAAALEKRVYKIIAG